MSLPQSVYRDVVFFGGKGGVGKTTLAAAAALASASRGETTLLVSTDPAHSSGDVLDVDLGPEPRAITSDLWACELDPEREARAYIDDVRDRVSQVAPPRLVAEAERQIDLARVSPGAEESALFERFTHILDEERGRFGRIVFDTAPTGQTLRLLSLPELMTTWIAGLITQRRQVSALGRMWRTVAGAAAGAPDTGEDPVLAALEERKDRFRRTRRILTDPARTAFVFVVTAERLPIRETARSVETLVRYGIPVGALLVNQLLLENGEGEFLTRRREREKQRLDDIRARFRDLPIAYVPLQEEDPVGLESLKRLASLIRGPSGDKFA